MTGYPILIVIPVGVTLFNISSPHEFLHVLVKQAVVHLEVEVDVPAKGGEPVVRYTVYRGPKNSLIYNAYNSHYPELIVQFSNSA